jgi:Predicted HD superfamily hydrolase involved in NAD metabolism
MTQSFSFFSLADFPYVSLTEITGDVAADVRNLLFANDKEDTFAHSRAVAETNVKIAAMYSLDERVCELCGYLHDISAVIEPSDMLRFAKENDMFIDEAEAKYPFLLHQRMSKMIACDYFRVTDEAVLSAIECHTTLKSCASDYDMALFVADKLSWDKDGSPPFYAAVSDGLNASLKRASERYIDYVIENGMILHPHSWLIQARQWLKNNQ